MLVLKPSDVKPLAKILASDLPVERKISKLQILALRCFPSSPVQNAVIAATRELEKLATNDGMTP